MIFSDKSLSICDASLPPKLPLTQNQTFMALVGVLRFFFLFSLILYPHIFQNILICVFTLQSMCRNDRTNQFRHSLVMQQQQLYIVSNIHSIQYTTANSYTKRSLLPFACTTIPVHKQYTKHKFAYVLLTTQQIQQAGCSPPTNRYIARTEDISIL